MKDFPVGRQCSKKQTKKHNITVRIQLSGAIYVSKKSHNDLEVIKLFLLYIFFSLFNVDKFHGTLCVLGYDVMCNFMIFNLKLYYCIVYCIIYIILYYIILYNIVLKNAFG